MQRRNLLDGVPAPTARQSAAIADKGLSVPEVGVIDYGAGNIRSLTNAIEYVGARVHVVCDRADIDGSTHLVLPGVGAFGFCSERLRATGILPALEDWTFTRRRPILGVCVGMQLLADSSEEFGLHAGLGWLGGNVTKFEITHTNIRIPHVGWNSVRFEEDFGECRQGLESDFYFDHSFAYRVPRCGRTLARCVHGHPFSAAIRERNIVGAQFHPEKSQAAGMRFLRSFLAM